MPSGEQAAEAVGPRRAVADAEPAERDERPTHEEAPTRPSSSPMMAKMKSVWAYGQEAPLGPGVAEADAQNPPDATPTWDWRSGSPRSRVVGVQERREARGGSSRTRRARSPWPPRRHRRSRRPAGRAGAGDEQHGEHDRRDHDGVPRFGRHDDAAQRPANASTGQQRARESAIVAAARRAGRRRRAAGRAWRTRTAGPRTARRRASGSRRYAVTPMPGRRSPQHQDEGQHRRSGIATSSSGADRRSRQTRQRGCAPRRRRAAALAT